MSQFFVRELDPEMGLAVAKRTYLRIGEGWGDLAVRVALGNSLLHETGEDDRIAIQNSIANGSLLTSGRHLQHGDVTQPGKNLELFSNCSTSCTSFLKFLLLLNGSGVGRNYSDDVMVVDWANMPNLYCILSKNHPDFTLKTGINGSAISILEKESIALYPDNPDLYYEVEDSREGWAKALEILEVAAFQGRKYDHFVFDFSNIRRSGSPIRGMQNRPASGPIPLIYAFVHIAMVKYLDLPIWKQTMIIDHYAAEVVANGGSRRSSRICIKYWKDNDIIDFIKIKKENPWLWSSNNSVAVDLEYWNEAGMKGTKANEIFNIITSAAFEDGTAEPGIITVDRLHGNY